MGIFIDGRETVTSYIPGDIYEVVPREEASDERKPFLGIFQTFVPGELSVLEFRDTGEKLQRVRHKDYWFFKYGL